MTPGAAMNHCEQGGYLVGAEGFLPEDPSDFKHENLPILGCSNLGCGRCGARVRNIVHRGVRSGLTNAAERLALYDTAELASSPLLVPRAGHRGYLCRCGSHSELQADSLQDPDRDVALPVSWSCQGHPLLELPHDLDGERVSCGEELASLAERALRGFTPAGARPEYQGGNWPARLRGRLTGTRWADVVTDLAVGLVTDDDPATRGRALQVLVRFPSLVGARCAVELLGGDRRLFAGVPDGWRPYARGETLEDTLWEVVAAQLSEPGPARDLLRAEALAAGKGQRAVYRALALGDSAWLAEHVEAVARATPARRQALRDALCQVYPADGGPLVARVEAALAPPAERAAPVTPAVDSLSAYQLGAAAVRAGLASREAELLAHARPGADAELLLRLARHEQGLGGGSEQAVGLMLVVESLLAHVGLERPIRPERPSEFLAWAHAVGEAVLSSAADDSPARTCFLLGHQVGELLVTVALRLVADELAAAAPARPELGAQAELLSAHERAVREQLRLLAPSPHLAPQTQVALERLCAAAAGRTQDEVGRQELLVVLDAERLRLGASLAGPPHTPPIEPSTAPMSVRNVSAHRSPDGTITVLRRSYRPGRYELPPDERKSFEDSHTSGNGETTQELLDQRDGPFVSYREVRRYEREGTRWVLLQHNVCDWCVEVEDRQVEILHAGLPAIRFPPPARAFELALEHDRTRPHKVLYG